MMRFAMFLLLLGITSVANCVVEVVEFSDHSLKERYYALIAELRCPKCQNQNLADSNSPISKDLRQQIHKLLEEGRTDTEIADYLTARYSDFILYKPKVSSRTWLLWLGPLVVFVGSLVFVLLGLRSKPDNETVPLSSDEELLIDMLLKSREEPE